MHSGTGVRMRPLPGAHSLVALLLFAASTLVIRCLRQNGPCQLLRGGGGGLLLQNLASQAGKLLGGLLVLAHCGLPRELWANGQSAHLKRYFTGLAGDDVGHECPTSCPESVEQVQLTGMRPPVLAHVLSPAEPESRVCPHEDGPHLGKPAHRRTSNLRIGGQLLPTTLDGRMSNCPHKTVVGGGVALVHLRHMNPGSPLWQEGWRRGFSLAALAPIKALSPNLGRTIPSVLRPHKTYGDWISDKRKNRC